MAKIKNTNDNLCWRDCGVKGMQADTTPLNVSVVISQKIRKQPFSRLVIPLLGIYSKDAQLYHKDIFSTMFIAALFVIART